jgi:hypothetical protein
MTTGRAIASGAGRPLERDVMPDVLYRSALAATGIATASLHCSTGFRSFHGLLRGPVSEHQGSRLAMLILTGCAGP